jgi:hypothetical protein
MREISKAAKRLERELRVREMADCPHQIAEEEFEDMLL